MCNSLYDAATLGSLIAILTLLVKSICANNKSTLTKIIMTILAGLLIGLFIFMVIDINQNGS